MSNFIKFRDAVNAQIEKMENSDSGLFKTHIDKGVIWSTYLGAFPEGSNPIYMENTVHDCNCCKDFIRDLGRAVSINKNNEIETCWDINIDDTVYQSVADALAQYVREQVIASVYVASSLSLHVKENFSQDPNKMDKFSHFYYSLSPKYQPKSNAAELMGASHNNFNVLKRGLSELTVDSLENILNLIQDNNLYLGEQNLQRVSDFLKLKKEFEKVDESKKDAFVWRNISKHPSVVLFRNSVIGTLAVDMSEGVSLEAAVALYEKKVAPDNYKRSKSIVTKQMIESAQKKVEELGLEDSLERCHAKLDDITINNVIWADTETTAKLNKTVFDRMFAEATVNNKVDTATNIGLLDFIEKVVPSSESVRLYLEGKHTNNLVSLVAPKYKDAKNIMKWDNGFSWSYNGNMTDSIKARVANKGGNVEGDLRISLSWFNTDDLDIHVRTPRHGTVYHGSRYAGGLELDVDMNINSNTASTEAVENVSAGDIKNIQEGIYEVSVRNYTKRNTENTGFDIEVEFLGDIYNFTIPTSPKDSETRHCFSFSYSVEKGISFLDVKMNASSSSTEVWGVNTNNFHDVKAIMFSPNHWDDNKVGNRHVFFMLGGCNNPEPVRGFYNEYLIESLHADRKVFEVLASKMKAEPTTDQLSGLGFSTTKRGDTFQASVKTSKGTKFYNVVS